MSHLLEELTRLLETAPDPKDFYPVFLQRIQGASQALGAAIWKRAVDGSLLLEHQINAASLGLDLLPDAVACHQKILQVATQRDRPMWVPPLSGPKGSQEQLQAANLTNHGLLLVPVLVEKQVAGLLEIWFNPVPEASVRRHLARFLTEASGFLAASLHGHQWRTLQEQQQIWTRLEAFVRLVHRSLDPQEVAQSLAEEGRRILECDQLSVALPLGKKIRVAAVSGAAVVEQNSRLVQRMQALCQAVGRQRETLIYQGQRDESLPPALARALDDYLAESNCKTLIVLPLLDDRVAASVPCAVLVAESYEHRLPAPQLQDRLDMLARHAGPALHNALEMSRMPLQGISRWLARQRGRMAEKPLLRWGLYTLPFLCLSATLVFVQVPLRLEARGQLMPVQRQIVYATQHGKIVEMRARHGEYVDRGQELLFVEDLETQLQVDQLAIKIGSGEQRLALLNEQMSKSSGAEERNTLARERINQEYELRKAIVERDILLQGSRSPRKAPMLAPLTGKVVTFDTQEQLLGKTVKPGDPLLRVAAVKGSWEIELQLPERAIGPLREGLHTSFEGFVAVDLLLASQPHRTYQGRLYREGLGGETTVKENNVVLPVRVRISDEELIHQLETLPVGLEVRTKVHCGQHPLGSVWFFELWEFFYEHLLF